MRQIYWTILPYYYPFYYVILYLRHSQRLRNSWIYLSLYLKHLFKGALRIDRNGFYIFFQDFWNFKDIYPFFTFICVDFYSKCHIFMKRRIVNTPLNWFTLWTVFWPKTSEIFTIYCKFDHFWVNLLYILEDNMKLIVKLWNKIPRIEECLEKVVFWIITLDRYLFSDKIISSSISHPFFRTMNWKISTMYFFRGYPQDMGFIVVFRFDFLYKFLSFG